MKKLFHAYPGFGILAISLSLGACNEALQTPDELVWNEHRAPEYTDSQDWAALPGRGDLADEVPKRLPDSAKVYSENELPIDVFFV